MELVSLGALNHRRRFILISAFRHIAWGEPLGVLLRLLLVRYSDLVAQWSKLEVIEQWKLSIPPIVNPPSYITLSPLGIDSPSVRERFGDISARPTKVRFEL